MGIEQAFGLGGPAEVIVVGQKADYRPYELRIAKLEGAVRGYQEGIAELTAVAKRNKFLAEKNALVADLWMDTLRALIDKGSTTKEEANAIKFALEKNLSDEEIEIIHTKY